MDNLMDSTGTIEERILASSVFLSGDRFTSATLYAYLKDSSKGGINFAITKLKARGDIKFVMTASSGRGASENVYTRASKNTNWLKLHWVSTPSPDEYSPRWC